MTDVPYLSGYETSIKAVFAQVSPQVGVWSLREPVKRWSYPGTGSYADLYQPMHRAPTDQREQTMPELLAAVRTILDGAEQLMTALSSRTAFYDDCGIDPDVPIDYRPTFMRLM